MFLSGTFEGGGVTVAHGPLAGAVDHAALPAVATYTPTEEVLDVADVDGDGVLDVLLSSPTASDLGLDRRGAVYLLGGELLLGEG